MQSKKPRTIYVKNNQQSKSNENLIKKQIKPKNEPNWKKTPNQMNKQEKEWIQTNWILQMMKNEKIKDK